MPTDKSSIATQIPGRTTNVVTRVPWGICYHSTGSGVTESAVYVRKKNKKGKKVLSKRPEPLKPIDVALKVYLASQNGSNGYPWGGPGYVIDHDGTIYQIAGDRTRTNHVGSIVKGQNRRNQYISGKWLELCAPVAVAQWNAHWGPMYKNPQQLFPSKFPNTDFIGVEMIPCGNGFGKPMRKGLRFTKEQHDAAVRLAIDVARRNKFPDVWWKTPRILGHEDVGLIDRHDKGGGWDPGWLREEPHFDFDHVKDAISARW